MRFINVGHLRNLRVDAIPQTFRYFLNILQIRLFKCYLCL